MAGAEELCSSWGGVRGQDPMQGHCNEVLSMGDRFSCIKPTYPQIIISHRIWVTISNALELENKKMVCTPKILVKKSYFEGMSHWNCELGGGTCAPAMTMIPVVDLGSWGEAYPR